jgi:hypothetical protein
MGRRRPVGQLAVVRCVCARLAVQEILCKSDPMVWPSLAFGGRMSQNNATLVCYVRYTISMIIKPIPELIATHIVVHPLDCY